MSDRKSRVLLACATAICVAALYLKQPQAFRLPQFYAEDGMKFFANAYNEGWASLFNTSGGYFHLWPRLLANLLLTFGVPLEYIPAVFTYSCLPMYFVLWLKIFTRLRFAPETRLFLALATVLVPIGNEIFMNQTNIQWVMALIPVVLFCGDAPQRPWSRVLDYVLLILCLFTGPYALFLFPIFAIAALRDQTMRRQRIFLFISLAATVACVLSLTQFGTLDRVLGASRVTWYGFVQLAFRSYYFPLFSTWTDSAPAWMVMALAAVLPLALFLLGRAVVRSGNRFAIVAFAAGLPLFAATFISYGRYPLSPSPFANAIRNFYLPMVLLLWSLIAITRVDGRRLAAWTMVFCWFAVQIAWIAEPRDMPDRHWKVYAHRLKSGQALKIPITPSGWTMELKERTSPAR